MECFHDFTIIFSNSEAHVELCKRCHKEFTYVVDWNGDTDNVQYGEDHKHDFFTPWSEEYKFKALQDKFAPITR